jgi:hypothetical protein
MIFASGIEKAQSSNLVRVGFGLPSFGAVFLLLRDAFDMLLVRISGKVLKSQV